MGGPEFIFFSFHIDWVEDVMDFVNFLKFNMSTLKYRTRFKDM